MTNAKERNIFKGISFPFRFGSSGGVATSELTHGDFSRIKESIHQIMMTFISERVMRGSFGSNTRDFLFEVQGDDTSVALLQHEIKKAIESNEDRVIVNSLRVYTGETAEGTIIIDADIHIIKFVKDVDFRFNVDLPSDSIGGM